MKTVRHPLSRERLITQTSGDSLVQAGFGNDTDVNRIIERFTRTGVLPTANSEPQYADVTGLQEDLTDLIQKQRDTHREIMEVQKSIEEQKQQKRDQDAIELENLKKQTAAPTDSTPTQ